MAVIKNVARLLICRRHLGCYAICSQSSRASSYNNYKNAGFKVEILIARTLMGVEALV